jgi:hypothetical protein
MAQIVPDQVADAAMSQGFARSNPEGLSAERGLCSTESFLTPFLPHRHVLGHQWTYEDQRARLFRCEDVLFRYILLSFAC